MASGNGLWCNGILAEPGGSAPATVEGDSIMAGGKRIGQVQSGILRFGVPEEDPSIEFYKAIGGANFHDRAKVGYAMTTLDTPVYHDYLKLIRPTRTQPILADIGGGDGRNAVPWLAETDARVVVIDPIVEGLLRFRARLESEHPQWLDRVLLVEADARRIPLRSGSCDAVQAVEALCFLNEDYEVGMRECRRLMSGGAHLLVAERDYESGLIVQLLYGEGVKGMLRHAKTNDFWDGPPDRQVRSRSFTREQLVENVERCGLHVLDQCGVSSFSMIMSYLRGQGRLGGPEDEPLLAQVHDLLKRLGRDGRMMRSHVLICRAA
jgi:SAM-dependent methyltransferase